MTCGMRGCAGLLCLVLGPVLITVSNRFERDFVGLGLIIVGLWHLTFAILSAILQRLKQ